MATSIMKIPGRALKIGAKTASAGVSRHPEAPFLFFPKAKKSIILVKISKSR